jgi:hypothetical protein
MNNRLQIIISTLDGISSVENESELHKLQSAIDDLFTSDQPELGIGGLLRIFERFPDQDGHGIFWSILHGSESLPAYEGALIESVRRQPSEFGLLMVNRLLNSGRTQVDGIELMALLEEVAGSSHYPEGAREGAREYIEWQRSRT